MAATRSEDHDGLSNQLLPHPRQPILYFQKQPREVSEINLNFVKYFANPFNFCNRREEPMQRIRAHLLQSMCSKTYGIMIQNDTKKPGHIPLIEDLVSCYDEGACVVLYWLIERFYFSDSPFIVPSEIEEVIDLKPNLSVNSINNYSFPPVWRSIFVGFFTDTVHQMTVDTAATHLRFHVESCALKSDLNNRWPIRKRYHRVSYKAYHISSAVEQYGEVDRGSVVLIWNAPGCSRPSFMENLATLYEKYNSILFIILEVRLGKYAANEVIHSFPDEYQAKISSLESRPGGVMALWKQGKLKSKFLHVSDEARGIVIDAFFQAPLPPLRPRTWLPQVQLYDDSLISNEEAGQGRVYTDSGLALIDYMHEW